jgi:Leucine-rich repeat (LRR) protein
MGKVMVPPRTILELTASEALSKQPELFGGFGANDLTQLILNPALSWSNKHVACISNLTGLSGLTINEADITDGCIADLNKLAHLNDLSANFTGITGAGFAQLRRLPQLRMFTAAGTNTLSVALQKMTGCQSVGSLQANQCNLTDKDMQVIGNMSNLEGLYVSENIHITDDGVRSICQLRTLHMLDLSQTAVTPLCINMLKKLPKLRWLGISTQKWSKADQLRIKHNLPVAVDVAPESNEIDESLK